MKSKRPKDLAGIKTDPKGNGIETGTGLEKEAEPELKAQTEQREKEPQERIVRLEKFQVRFHEHCKNAKDAVM